MFLLYLLLLFILIGALIAVEIHNLLSSVIAVGTIGLGLCMVFLLLGAPDLAITQLVVEILVLIILIRATLVSSLPDTYKGREFMAYAITLLFILFFGGFAFYAFKSLPPFGEPMLQLANRYIYEGWQKTGATNLVAGVMLDFRSLDMLGAATVLFAAIVGTLVILRMKGRKEVNERDEPGS